MKKRVLPLLLVLAMVLALLPTGAMAAAEFQTTDGVLVKYNGPGGDVVIPNSVTGIGDKAFYSCSGLKSVTIPNSVTSIGEEAFMYCGMTSVTIPNSVVTIGARAFRGCDELTGVDIPASVTFLGDSAFYGCDSLTSVVVPGSVTKIGREAFAYCEGLVTATIGDGVTSMGGRTFDGCISLESVTIPDSVTSTGDAAFWGCRSLKSVTIPDGVTRIESFTFFNCESLISVTIPASVADIGVLGMSAQTVVRGAEGSYAQLWAMDCGYDFEAVLPPAATPGMTAYASTQSVNVDGDGVEFQCYALKDDNGNMTNYVKLRDLASVLNNSAAQFQVGWNGSVAITTGQAYTPNGSEMTTPYSGDRTYAEAGWEFVLLNGEYKGMAGLLLKDAQGNGYTYFKLRDLGEALGFNVGWAADKGIYIESGKPYDPAN